MKKVLNIYIGLTVALTGLFILMLGLAPVTLDPTQWSTFASKLNVFCNDNMSDMLKSGYSECLNPQTMLVIGPTGELFAQLLMLLWGGLAVIAVGWVLLAILTIISDNEDDLELEEDLPI